MTSTATSLMKRWAVLLVAALVVAGMLMLAPKLLNRTAAVEVPALGASTSAPAEIDSMKWTRGTVNHDVVDCRPHMKANPQQSGWWLCG